MQTLLVAVSIHQLSIFGQTLLFFFDGKFAASLCLCEVVVCAEAETDCCDDGDVPGECELVQGRREGARIKLKLDSTIGKGALTIVHARVSSSG
jgi:hypothetical protein